ncbi:MAG: LolA-like protein [Candidatus Latescibacterota bacterium]
MYKFILVMLLFLFLTSLAFADMQTLTEGADYGDALVLNGKGKMHFSLVLVDSLSPRIAVVKQERLKALEPGHFLVFFNSRDVDVSFAFSGVKVWMEEKTIAPLPTGKRHVRNWRIVYDGEKVDFLRMDGIGPKGLIKPMGEVRAKDILREDQLDPRYYANAVQGIPVGSFLRGTAKEGALQNVRITGEETLEGVPCQVVEASVADSDVTYKVWIAPGRMYRPVKAEIRDNAGVKVVRSQFRQYGGEIWFPSQVTVEQFLFIEGSAPVLNDRLTLTVAEDFQVNAGVSDNLFRLKFPKGLKVYDWRTNTSFTAQ